MVLVGFRDLPEIGGDEGENQALGKEMNAAAGWGNMWDSFNNLAIAESGWNRFAENSSSGAYGIPQALPESKLPAAGQSSGGSHAGPQIDWMLAYIKDRYGDPANAWSTHQSQGWYEKGGKVPGRKGKHKSVWAAGGEMILPEGISRNFLRYTEEMARQNREHRQADRGMYGGTAAVVSKLDEVRDSVNGLAVGIVDSMDHKIRESVVTHGELRTAGKANQRRLEAQGPRYERGI